MRKFGPPGVFGAANLDGGALGLGTGFSISEFTQTYFDLAELPGNRNRGPKMVIHLDPLIVTLTSVSRTNGLNNIEISPFQQVGHDFACRIDAIRDSDGTAVTSTLRLDFDKGKNPIETFRQLRSEFVRELEMMAK